MPCFKSVGSLPSPEGQGRRENNLSPLELPGRARQGFRGLWTSCLWSAHDPSPGGHSRGGSEGAVRLRVTCSHSSHSQGWTGAKSETRAAKENWKDKAIGRWAMCSLPIHLFQHICNVLVKYLEASKVRWSGQPSLLSGLGKGLEAWGVAG